MRINLPTLQAYRDLVAQCSANINDALPGTSFLGDETVPEPVRPAVTKWNVARKALADIDKAFFELGDALQLILVSDGRTEQWRGEQSRSTVATFGKLIAVAASTVQDKSSAALDIARFTQLESTRGRPHPVADTLRAKHGVSDLRGDSVVMERVRQSIALFAKSSATVLIQGETGTGKELAAQAIHRESTRARQPFIAINCGAVAESLLESELFGYEEGAFTGSRRGGHAGLFESAHRGTLFLDEIGEMPLPLQTRLLRVLEEREIVRVGGTRPIAVDVRIVSATHCDLDARLTARQFRADLFYRLGVLRLTLPPLRERAEDAVALAEWCLKNALAALGVRPHANLHAEVLACAPLFGSYAWPGNVREVRNLMERLALFLAAEPLQALSPSFVLAIAPEFAGGSTTDAESSASMVSKSHMAATETISQVVARFGGNRVAAANHLGISRTTLWRKLRQRA